MSIDLYPRNEYDEPLEKCGDFWCNLDYWDCECKDNYIHHEVKSCSRCGTLYEDAPPAREKEVKYLREHGSLHGYAEYTVPIKLGSTYDC